MLGLRDAGESAISLQCPVAALESYTAPRTERGPGCDRGKVESTGGQIGSWGVLDTDENPRRRSKRASVQATYLLLPVGHTAS